MVSLLVLTAAPAEAELRPLAAIVLRARLRAESLAIVAAEVVPVDVDVAV
jgi:hypothetical protein